MALSPPHSPAQTAASQPTAGSGQQTEPAQTRPSFIIPKRHLVPTAAEQTAEQALHTSQANRQQIQVNQLLGQLQKHEQNARIHQQNEQFFRQESEYLHHQLGRTYVPPEKRDWTQPQDYQLWFAERVEQQQKKEQSSALQSSAPEQIAAETSTLDAAEQLSEESGEVVYDSNGERAVRTDGSIVCLDGLLDEC